MYVSDDPRSKLQSSSVGAAPDRAEPTGPRFAAAEYARFSDTPPQISAANERTWITRGQNFVVAYSEVTPGARLARTQHPDEYAVLIPERGVAATVESGRDVRTVPGYVLVIMPPGDSAITAHSTGVIVRIFSATAGDLNSQASNATAYAQPHPNIPPYERWPAPPDGYRIRIYDLNVAPLPGRFGRIWRCTTLMINVHPLEPGPRDLARLSPHHHDDFEQGSLALKGSFTHHIRWPWTPDMKDWREDDHQVCPAPSIAVIPPPAIHTSAGTDPALNHLVDLFSPPRMDFSKMEGWVLNAAEYPMPPQPETV